MKLKENTRGGGAAAFTHKIYNLYMMRKQTDGNQTKRLAL
jgi:hypothetical protein